MTTSFAPGKTGFSRVFLIPGRARPDHEVDYQGCMMAGALDQSFGDIEKIECPSPTAFGQFLEVGRTQGAIDRATTSLMGRYAADLRSEMLRLARLRCAFDIQINFGACSDPRLWNTFSKKVVIEDAFGTGWSTDDLGALASGDNAAINETLEISAQEFYEILPMTFAERGASVVTNPLVDVVNCSIVSCGDCEDEDGGCDVIYAVGASSPGSPGTAPDVIWTTDKAANLNADEITTLDNTQDADAVACLGDYVLVVSNDEAYLHYKTKALINAGTGANWAEITTGFVGANNPMDIWSVGNYAFIVGDNGYVYGTANPTTGVTVLDAGLATTENLLAVHAISDRFAVAVGENGAIIATENRTTWRAIAGPVVDDLNCVWVKDKDEWFIGTAAGGFYYSLDAGENWTATALPVTATSVNDVNFPNESIAFMAVTIAGPAGRILRTTNGGYDWVVTPEQVGTIPANNAITAVAGCPADENFVVGVGTADNGTDGIFVRGDAPSA